MECLGLTINTALDQFFVSKLALIDLLENYVVIILKQGCSTRILMEQSNYQLRGGLFRGAVDKKAANAKCKVDIFFCILGSHQYLVETPCGQCLKERIGGDMGI